MYQRKRLSSWTRAFVVSEAVRIGVSRAARQSGISRRTVYRWLRRAPDFADRSCRPHHSPRRSPDTLEGTVLALRLETKDGPDRSVQSSACIRARSTGSCAATGRSG